MSTTPIDHIDVMSADAGWEVAGALLREIWPPEVVARLPWKDIAWASPERHVLAFDRAGDLIGHAGLFRRKGAWSHHPVTIAGVGGVATRADRHGQGVASAVLRRVVCEMRDAYGADFGLLFCEPRHAPVYKKLGWHRFQGDVFVEQPQGRIRFVVTDPYVFDFRLAPREGEIDLCGLPW